MATRGRLPKLKDDESRVVPILKSLLPILSTWKFALRRRRVAIQADLVDARREAESTTCFHAAPHPSSPLRASARQLRTLANLNIDLASATASYLRHPLASNL